MCLLIQLQSWVSNEVSSAPVLQKPLVPNPKRVHCLLPAAPGYQMNSWVVRTSWNPNLHVTSYKSQVIYIRESPMEAPTNFFRTSNKVDFPGFTLRFFRWPVKDSGNPTAKHLKKKRLGFVSTHLVLMIPTVQPMETMKQCHIGFDGMPWLDNPSVSCGFKLEIFPIHL